MSAKGERAKSAEERKSGSGPNEADGTCKESMMRLAVPCLRSVSTLEPLRSEATTNYDKATQLSRPRRLEA